MELTRAQKAAIEDIKYKIIQIGASLKSILGIIESYGLEKKMDVLESVYEILMEEERFEDAASFAKKYGL